jgi:hypothetical protein
VFIEVTGQFFKNSVLQLVLVLKNEKGLAIILYRVCNEHGICGLNILSVWHRDDLIVPEDYLRPILLDLGPEYSSTSEQLLSLIKPAINRAELLGVLNSMDA